MHERFWKTEPNKHRLPTYEFQKTVQIGNLKGMNQYIYKPPYTTNVGARFIVHFLHYMFRPLLVLQKISHNVSRLSIGKNNLSFAIHTICL
jgi:hypothetical protein